VTKLALAAIGRVTPLAHPPHLMNQTWKPSQGKRSKDQHLFAEC